MGSPFVVQAAEQTAHPNCGPRRRPGITSNRCTQIDEEPIFRVKAHIPGTARRYVGYGSAPSAELEVQLPVEYAALILDLCGLINQY